MSFHCDKLCSGACCASLQWALRAQSLIDRGLPAALSGMSEQQATALYDVSDPVKLAELLAMALRARGVDVVSADHHWTGSIVIVLRGDERIVLSMPQARTVLAAIMALPADESSREACERIIRGDNG